MRRYAPPAENDILHILDIGVDEIAREIYKNGKAEIEDGTMKEMFIAALENSPTLTIAIKQAVVKMMG